MTATETETPTARREALLRKVRGLLAKAEDPAATPAEAEAFSAKAEELMARHAIDAALIDAKATTREAPDARRITIDGSYGLPKVLLLAAIATAHRCKVIRHTSRRRVVAATVVGYPSDMDVVELLFTSLSLQSTNAMLAAARERGRMQAAESVSFRTSFLYGFAATVGARLTAIREHAEQQARSDSPGTDLVLRDRSQDVEDRYDELFPNARSSRRSTIGNADGWHAGGAAGRRADLGQSRVGSTRNALGR